MESTLDPRLRDNADGEVVPASAAPATSGAASIDATKHDHGLYQRPLPPQSATSPSHQHHQLAPGHTNPLTPYTTSSTAFSPRTPSSTAPTPLPATGHVNHGHHLAQQAQAQAPYHADSSGLGDDGTPEAPGPDGHDPKKPRACESCRGLKVRCDPDPADPEGPCKRCAKAGRACVVTQPTRKRQKKTDSRVAELEKKIDALTASLHATRGGGAAGVGGAPTGNAPSTGGAGAAGGTVRDDKTGASAGAYGLSVMARDWAAQARDQGQKPARPPAAQSTKASFPPIELDPKIYQPPMVMAGQKRKFTETRDTTGDDLRDATAALPPSGISPEYSDVVDRGIISMSLAGELFARYTERMMEHLPGVVFAPESTVSEVRKTKPILFLSIMAAAASEMPVLQRQLNKELMQIIAEKVVVVGEKSLELVQTIQVATIWYWPPEHFEELKFYSLVHMAAIMAIELGLGRKKQNRAGFRKNMLPYSWKDSPWKKQPPADPTDIECRRAWLTCYFLATNTSMALHRPNLIRWTPFTQECIDILESSPEAAPTDKYLCQLVWTHKLSEDVGVQFSMDDPEANINIADPRTQYALKGFERELERHSASIPAELQQPTLRLSFHVLSLYMHESATQHELMEDRPSQPHESLRDSLETNPPLTPAHISAISACLAAVDGIFDVFLSMDVDKIRCLPIFNFVRVAYAVVILIKLYFTASSTTSELGKVINKDEMKVEQHIENLLDKFRATAADDKSRPAAKFLVILVMLRSWFQKQSQGAQPQEDGFARAASASNCDNKDGTAASSQAEFNNRSTANAGLQLLSEIATSNNQGSAGSNRLASDMWWSSGSNGNPTATNNGGRPQPAQPFMYNVAETAGTSSNPATDGSMSGAGTGVAALGGQPWLGGAFTSDFDYSTMADGLQQVVDMTMAGMADGSFGYGLENSMGLVMNQAPWMPSLMMGMPLDEALAAFSAGTSGGASPAPPAAVGVPPASDVGSGVVAAGNAAAAAPLPVQTSGGASGGYKL